MRNRVGPSRKQKNLASSETAARETRDQRLEAHSGTFRNAQIFSSSPVPFGYSPRGFSCCTARLSSSQTHSRSIEVLECRQTVSTPARFSFAPHLTYTETPCPIDVPQQFPVCLPPD